MNVLAIIQARMNSTRLPGKVMMPLGGMSVVELCERRVRRSGVATLIAYPRNDDAEIGSYTRTLGFGPPAFYGFPWGGPENDVLGRYIACATSQHPWPDIIVRITADCPLVLPEWIQETVGELLAGGAQYVGGRYDGVKGWDVEAFTIGALLKAAGDIEREHVTTAMQLRYLPRSYTWGDRGDVSLTLDTQEDYDRLTAIVNKLKNPVTASAQDILAAWEEVRATA